MKARIFRFNAGSGAAHGRSVAGFTLIELMIVMAVVAILASVAYPSYAAYLLRANRTAAQGVMTDLATRQHQFFLDTRGYVESVAALRSSIPHDIAAKYDISLVTDAGPPPGFTISAVPRAGQNADSCGTLSINAAGVKAPVSCW
jgi:type IV pilus assembly protein PilE